MLNIFPGGKNEGTKILQNLNNKDKHRALSTSISVIQSTGLKKRRKDFNGNQECFEYGNITISAPSSDGPAPLSYGLYDRFYSAVKIDDLGLGPHGWHGDYNDVNVSAQIGLSEFHPTWPNISLSEGLLRMAASVDGIIGGVYGRS